MQAPGNYLSLAHLSPKMTLVSFISLSSLNTTTPPSYTLHMDTPPVSHASQATSVEETSMFCLLLETGASPVIPCTQLM